MYFPRNWEFGSALSKLRNFGWGGLNTPNPPSVRHWIQLPCSQPIRLRFTLTFYSDVVTIRSTACCFRISGLFMCTTRFNVKKFYILHAERIRVFCVVLRTNSDYLFMPHQLFGFYKRDGVLFVFFWVIPRRLIYICRRFGTLYPFHLQRQV